jgi:hypothetical protein
MRNTVVAVLCLSAAAWLVWAQRTIQPPEPAPWEFRALFPHELGPGRYRHVEQYEVESLCRRGWELVSVTPWVIRNEERGTKDSSVIVTQNYLAYFFKRPRPRGDELVRPVPRPPEP